MQPHTRHDGPLKGTARLYGSAPGYLPGLGGSLPNLPVVSWWSGARARAVPKMLARGGVLCDLNEQGGSAAKSRR